MYLAVKYSVPYEISTVDNEVIIVRTMCRYALHLYTYLGLFLQNELIHPRKKKRPAVWLTKEGRAFWRTNHVVIIEENFRKIKLGRNQEVMTYSFPAYI